MKKIMVTLISFMIVISCVACGSNSATKPESDVVQSEGSVSANEGTDAEIAEDDSLMNIDTKYGTLYYPQKYQENIVLDQSEKDGILTIACNTAGNDKHLLFTIVIGDMEGDTVGTIKDEDGNTWNVIVDIPELTGIDELDEETQNQLYAMQEAVNIMIENME